MNRKQELLKLLRQKRQLKKEQRVYLNRCDLYEPHSDEWEAEMDKALSFHGPMFAVECDIIDLKKAMGSSNAR